MWTRCVGRLIQARRQPARPLVEPLGRGAANIRERWVFLDSALANTHVHGAVPSLLLVPCRKCVHNLCVVFLRRSCLLGMLRIAASARACRQRETGDRRHPSSWLTAANTRVDSLRYTSNHESFRKEAEARGTSPCLTASSLPTRDISLTARCLGSRRPRAVRQRPWRK